MPAEKRPYRDPTADAAIRSVDSEPKRFSDFFYKDPSSNRILTFTIKPPKPRSANAFTSQHTLLELLNQKGSTWQPITPEDYRKLQKEDARRQVSWKAVKRELLDAKSKSKKS